MIEKEAERLENMTDFKNRYIQYNNNLVNIDINKLNEDIIFVNNVLNLYIEPIKINNN